VLCTGLMAGEPYPSSSLAERAADEYPRRNPPTESCLAKRNTHGLYIGDRLVPSFFTPTQADGTKRCEGCGHILAGMA
jgi:hypothetical protein